MATDPNWPNVELFVTPNYLTDSGEVKDLSTRGHRCVVITGGLSNDSVFSSIGSIKFPNGGSVGWYNESFLIPASTDFTAEFSFYYPVNTNAYLFWIASGGADAAQRIAIYTDGSGRLAFSRWGQPNVLITAGAAFSANTKHHFRMARSGSTNYYFLNGALLGSNSDSTAFGSDSGSLRISAPAGGAGYVSGIRFTKGVCLSTTSFTPPDDRFSTTASSVAGIVRDSAGSPVSRLVRAYRRSDGKYAGAAISSATTGAYSISVQSADELSVIALDDVAGLLQNDLIKRALPA